MPNGHARPRPPGTPTRARRTAHARNATRSARTGCANPSPAAQRATLRIGATAEGKLLSLQHDFVNHVAMLDEYKEDCGESTALQYSVPNLRVLTSGQLPPNPAELLGSTADRVLRKATCPVLVVRR